MDLSFRRTAFFSALLLLFAAITQAIYTGLAMSGADVPRHVLWGTEAALFALLAALAGAGLAQARAFHLGWSAICAASVLNVVQVGAGLTLFAPFREAAQAMPELAPAASGIVAFSFMVYNAAKALLALAAIVFGAAKIDAGAKVLGGLSVAVGAVALVANMAAMAAGRDMFGAVPIAGGSGVLATVLLSVCLFTLPRASSSLSGLRRSDER
jgi:hypothetical protein